MKQTKYLAISLAFLLNTTTGTPPRADEAQNLCRSLPHSSGPYMTRPLKISTYHVTGVPGSERLLELTWPSKDLSPFSGVGLKRNDNAWEGLTFYFPHISLEAGGRHKADYLPKIDLTVTGVDKYPLYSDMAWNAGYFGRDYSLLRHEDGYTYHSSEGFIVTQEQNMEGWVQYTYPDALRSSNGEDSWYLGKPDVDGIERLLECANSPSGEYHSCTITAKLEPFRYSARFPAADLDKIWAVDAFANDFVSCILEGF